MQTLTTRKLTGEIWNTMTPREAENLRARAQDATLFSDPKSLDVCKRWIAYWGEEKRALIKEYKRGDDLFTNTWPGKGGDMSAPTTITEAWGQFSEMHGKESPLRTLNELRSKIQEHDLEYGKDDDAWGRFWDALFLPDGWYSKVSS